jgi:hypothetical protein
MEIKKAIFFLFLVFSSSNVFSETISNFVGPSMVMEGSKVTVSFFLNTSDTGRTPLYVYAFLQDSSLNKKAIGSITTSNNKSYYTISVYIPNGIDMSQDYTWKYGASFTTGSGLSSTSTFNVKVVESYSFWLLIIIGLLLALISAIGHFA